MIETNESVWATWVELHKGHKVRSEQFYAESEESNPNWRYVGSGTRFICTDCRPDKPIKVQERGSSPTLP